MPIESVDSSSTFYTDYLAEVNTDKDSLPDGIYVDIWLAESSAVESYPQYNKHIRALYATLQTTARQLLDEGKSVEKVRHFIDQKIEKLKPVLEKELESRVIHERNHAATMERFKQLSSTLASVDSSRVIPLLGVAAGATGGAFAGRSLYGDVQIEARSTAVLAAEADLRAAERTVVKVNHEHEYHKDVARAKLRNKPLKHAAVIRAIESEGRLNGSIAEEEAARKRLWKARVKLARPPVAGRVLGFVGCGVAGGMAGYIVGTGIGVVVDAASHWAADKLAEMAVEGTIAAYKEGERNGVNPVMIP